LDVFVIYRKASDSEKFSNPRAF